MKKIFLLSLFLITTNAMAATPWWEQPTVCRLSPSNCYPNMGNGYFFNTSDAESWDITSNCWGKKYICADALKNSTSGNPVALGRLEIADATRVNSDFDINVLNGDCFGVRKTSSDGTMVSINGSFVRVWCNGILENVDETVETGEITYGAQPTCDTLASDGYVAVQNGKCFGKFYDPARYFIQCNDETPSLIVLNGANYETGNTSYPATQPDADAIFNRMYENVHKN